MGVFTVLVACGLGLPMPEDITLISGGFLAGRSHGQISLVLMVIVGLLGILVGDSIIFKAGWDYGDALLHTRLGKHIPQDRVDKIRAIVNRHGSKFVMVARFVPGVRAVTYFVAGSSRMPYLTFAFYDGLAALVSAPLWVYLGYWAGKRRMFKQALDYARQFQVALLIALGVGAVIALVMLWNNRRKSPPGEATRSPLPAPGAERPSVEPPSGTERIPAGLDRP